MPCRLGPLFILRLLLRFFIEQDALAEFILLCRKPTQEAKSGSPGTLGFFPSFSRITTLPGALRADSRRSSKAAPPYTTAA
jgi:hypothetical protein